MLNTNTNDSLDFVRENVKGEKSGFGILADIESGAENMKECKERIDCLLKDNGESGSRGLQLNEEGRKFQLESELNTVKDEMENTSEKAKEALKVIKNVKNKNANVENSKKIVRGIMNDSTLRSIEGMSDILDDLHDVLK